MCNFFAHPKANTTNFRHVRHEHQISNSHQIMASSLKNIDQIVKQDKNESEVDHDKGTSPTQSADEKVMMPSTTITRVRKVEGWVNPQKFAYWIYLKNKDKKPFIKFDDKIEMKSGESDEKGFTKLYYNGDAITGRVFAYWKDGKVTSISRDSILEGWEYIESLIANGKEIDGNMEMMKHIAMMAKTGK